MSNNIQERIKTLVDTLADGRNTTFAKEIGVSEANIRSYLRGVSPKADFLEQVVRKYDINAHWLLTGEGEMTAKDNQGTSDMAMLLRMIESRDDKIAEQSRQIGRLEEQLRVAHPQKENLVGDAISSKSAHAV